MTLSLSYSNQQPTYMLPSVSARRQEGLSTVSVIKQEGDKANAATGEEEREAGYCYNYIPGHLIAPILLSTMFTKIKLVLISSCYQITPGALVPTSVGELFNEIDARAALTSCSLKDEGFSHTPEIKSYDNGPAAIDINASKIVNALSTDGGLRLNVTWGLKLWIWV